MPAYVAVQIDIHDPATYERYKELAPPSIIAHGGKYIARGGTVETLEGDWKPSRFVLLEFPSMDHARAWYHSPEYTRARAIRESCATGQMILVEGLDGPIG